ncbi:lytic transglycosylase domain-containing protein [Anaerobacillus alkaliphilus]|uniref:Lytic transglycosylase domain-containing protein n=1 Tax=Anaerobacillus alkaliphilus TaxID=1548597 RepID=A0A4Q0VUN0_9BACI|nr:lytic transglycosylase domain-containing protein [Anaerobacillus alkaliphilus]RXJ02096.1 lytic transglycosylase domain-containing protein [Anaerobacillus alkaliphilus]
MKKRMFIGIISFLLIILLSAQFKSEIKRGAIELLLSDQSIPRCYISVYKEAASEYEIPWEILAAIHRVETVFSNKDPMISYLGAVGHYQFMPRTWVGWEYPGTELGDINDGLDITDIDIIKKYGGYGVDASGDGKADPFDLLDATFTAAKYLADYGAASHDIEKALFAYNRSDEYVDSVLYYYDLYKQGFKEGKLDFYCYS